MRELFADILELCSHCHCMFWKVISLCNLPILIRGWNRGLNLPPPENFGNSPFLCSLTEYLSPFSIHLNFPFSSSFSSPFLLPAPCLIISCLLSDHFRIGDKSSFSLSEFNLLPRERLYELYES